MLVSVRGKNSVSKTDHDTTFSSLSNAVASFRLVVICMASNNGHDKECNSQGRLLDRDVPMIADGLCRLFRNSGERRQSARIVGHCQGGSW